MPIGYNRPVGPIGARADLFSNLIQWKDRFMKSWLRSILPGALALLAIALPSTDGNAQVEIGAEPPGFHGMLLFGSERIYMSHLPMFTPQHRYQAIWEVSFGEAGDAAYRAEWARPDNAGGIFTLAPQELFRLPDLTAARTSFTADVHVGHFERPGHRKLLEGATVTLKQAVHWHPFLPGDRRPDQATYVLFGGDDELFLAQWISTAPNYDQVLAVAPSAAIGRAPAGAQFVMLERDDEQPLRAGDMAAGLMIHRDRPDGPVQLDMLDLTVRSVYYLEEGELSSSHLAMR
jgi:hypothetical protein